MQIYVIYCHLDFITYVRNSKESCKGTVLA